MTIPNMYMPHSNFRKDTKKVASAAAKSNGREITGYTNESKEIPSASAMTIKALPKVIFLDMRVNLEFKSLFQMPQKPRGGQDRRDHYSDG